MIGGNVERSVCFRFGHGVGGCAALGARSDRAASPPGESEAAPAATATALAQSALTGARR